MKILVREANVEDAKLMAEMTRAAWAGRVAASSSGHRETTEGVALQLQSGGGFILTIHGTPAGSVRWLPVENQPRILEMLRMGILPLYRGQNLSRHLLEAVLHLAQASDVSELRLAVRADQPRLLHVYAAYGFDIAPELEYSHANPMEQAPIVMRRLLC